jgi:protein SCO1/2
MRENMTTWTTMLAITIMLIFAGPNPAVAQAGSGHKGDHSGHTLPATGAAPQGKAVDIELLDLALVDQDGRKLRFKSDVIGNRLAIIDTFYTTCDTICPILSALFVNLQHELGSRLGQDVVLVSISVDPGTDIPARLKKYAKRHGANPGWIFLTGGKRSVDRVLRGIGAYVRDYTQHAPAILVGDGRHGGWTRYYEFPNPDLVLGRLEELREARLAKAQ